MLERMVEERLDAEHAGWDWLQRRERAQRGRGGGGGDLSRNQSMTENVTPPTGFELAGAVP